MPYFAKAIAQRFLFSFQYFLALALIQTIGTHAECCASQSEPFKFAHTSAAAFSSGYAAALFTQNDKTRD